MWQTLKARWTRVRDFVRSKSMRAGPSGELVAEDVMASEQRRLSERRSALGLTSHPAGEDRWALALSGGGIRSATFALGVIQGFARIRLPSSAVSGGEPRMLPHFDYLSTVSGGGYVGGFLCSMFLPGRLRPWEQTTAADGPVEAASRAYEAFAHDPPGRMRRGEDVRAAHPGKFALSWLRDNGRYMAPTGAGDMLYAGAIGIRNWASLHYVIGTCLLLVFAFIAWARCAYAIHDADYAIIEAARLHSSMNRPEGLFESVWWSPILYWPLRIAVVLMIGVGAAFWLSHPRYNRSVTDKTSPYSMAAIYAALVIGLFWWLRRMIAADPEWEAISKMLLLLMIITGIALATHVVTCFRREGRRFARRTVREQRVVATRHMSDCLLLVLIVAALGFADTGGQTTYRLLSETNSLLWQYLSPAAVFGALAWIIRSFAHFTDQKEGGILSKLPGNAIAAVAGTLFLAMVVLFWQLVVHWIQWQGDIPDPQRLVDPDRRDTLRWIVLAAFVLAFMNGRFPGFVNLSSLQSLYSARLTRAYLGASNGKRFDAGAGSSRWFSVAEPHPEDDISRERYYGLGGNPAVLAPLHIINVTVNLTSDPDEQLVQRDRKGAPMAILPDGFSVDRRYYSFRSTDDAHVMSSIQMPLTIGQWVGASGAAFTTGLGRATSLGTSLALGLANVRLGVWWETGAGVDEAKGLQRIAKALFASQTHLYYEFTAQFHGLRREWQYISDGGHFENTAVYELLRPGRNVSLIVVCDDGADPLYRFEDLGNLARLARIDHRLEMRVDTAIAHDAVLGQVFGIESDFAPRDKNGPDAAAANSRKCAMLLTVRAILDSGVPSERRMNIVLLKPRVISTAPPDVLEYAKYRPAFPQEPTVDQFFDEAQWESYRKLGRCIVETVFGDGDGCVGPALWSYLAKAGRD